MPAVARILDANANRAREALRVMEDSARFALDDRELSTTLKTLRHGLREALAVLPPGWIEASRDTPADVGTTVQVEGEMDRAGLPAVAGAAGKRAGEALRVIEEMLKTVDPAAAGVVEGIRYRLYEVERRLLERLGTGVARQWTVCVLLTESICRHAWDDVLAAIVDGGADCIQVREKTMPGKDLVERTRRVIDVARPRGVSVIVNDRADVALAAGADGVHVGQDDLAVADVRRLAGRNLLVGVSTHDPDEARRAVTAGADVCGVGAMFASTLKPDRVPAGPATLRHFIDAYPHIPHLAIGGITPDNVNEVIEAGGRGVAVSSAVCGARDPGAVVAALRSSLDVRGRNAETPKQERRPGADDRRTGSIAVEAVRRPSESDVL